MKQKQVGKFSKELIYELPRVLIRMNREIFTSVPKLIVGGYLFTMLLFSLNTFVFRIMDAKLINHLQTRSMDLLGPVLIGYIIFRMSPNWLVEIKTRLLQRSSQMIGSGFRYRLLKKKSSLDVAYFETSKFHDELSNADRGADIAENMFVDEIDCLVSIFDMLFGILSISIAGWFYVVIILATAIPSLINMIRNDAEGYVFINNRRSDVRKQEYFSKLFSTGSVIDLKIFQLENFFMFSWKNFTDRLQKEKLSFDDKKSLSRLGLNTVSIIGVGWVIYSLIMNGFHNHTKIGTMIFALGGIGLVRSSIFESGRIFTKIVGNLRYIRDYFQVLDAEPMIKNGIAKIHFEKGPEIEFQNVSFRYHADGLDVLKDVSFKILPGQKIGIVGINGAGKSTLINLLMRFYDPTAGRILVNGYDLNKLDLDSYRKYIGFVSQKVTIQKAHTIKQLIEMGALDRSGQVSDTEWNDILNHSGVADFLPDMKDGINQVLGKEFEKGTRLSGGQEQRIAIARVLYRKPMMYIFDEPTSNFDPLIEDRFFTAFNELPDQTTSFLVSHSLRIVRKADQILVFDHGQIIESGSHNELIQNNGIYFQMFHAQSKDYMPCGSAV